MGFGPYSQVVKPAEYQDEINPNLLLKGAETENANTLNNLKGIADQASSVFNIPSYGKDREKLQEIQQGLLDGIKNTPLGDLNNPQAQSSIRGLIRSVTNSPDVQAIAQRGYTYQDMLKEQKEAVKRGENYLNPGFDDAQKYYSGSDYLQNKSFNSNGFIGADLGKKAAEVFDKLKGKSRIAYTKNGSSYVLTESDPNEMKAATSMFLSDPVVRKTLEYNFHQQHSDDELTQGAKGFAESQYNNALSDAQTAFAAAQTYEVGSDKYNEYMGHSIDAQKRADYAKKSMSSPDLNKAFYVQDQLNNYLTEQGKNIQAAHEIHTEGELKEDQYALHNLDHINRLNEHMEEKKDDLLISGANSYGLTNSEYNELKQKGSVTKNGTNITLNDVAKATVTNEANASYQKALQQATAKAQVKNSILGSLGKGSKISNTDDINIGGINQTKAEWTNIINRGIAGKGIADDSESIMAIIKGYPEYFNIPAGTNLDALSASIGTDGKVDVVIPGLIRDSSQFQTGIRALNTAINKADLEQKKAKTEMVHILNPNGSVVEIPKDSANSYIKAYPGSKQQ